MFRQKKDTTFPENRQQYKTLVSLEIVPGQRQVFSKIKITPKKGFGRFNLAVYWQRKYKGKQEKTSWYLLTNFDNLETALIVYKKRFGIEAMFKDCKTGGSNLEASKASPDRLVRLIMLIALAMTAA